MLVSFTKRSAIPLLQNKLKFSTFCQGRRLFSSKTIDSPLDVVPPDVPFPLPPLLDGYAAELCCEQRNEDLCFSSIAQLDRYFKSGITNPSELLESHLYRMNYLKKYNFFTNEEPLGRKDYALESDYKYATKQTRLLEGILFSVKDNFRVINHTASHGSRLMQLTKQKEKVVWIQLIFINPKLETR
jgi:hypothetical protein